MKVFVISLKSSTERRKSIKNKLESIRFTFFDAVNLNDDPDNFIFSLYNPNKTKKYKGYFLESSEIGCFASHISLWKKCVELNEAILIMEDNIDIDKDFEEKIHLLEELGNKYGILKIHNTFDRRYKVFENIDLINKVVSNFKGGCGTLAYVITPKAAQKYLDSVQGFFEPVDDFIENEWRTKQTVYTLMPYLVSRANITSTIGKRKIKINGSIKDKFNAEAYRFYKKTRQFFYNIFKK